MIEHCSKWLESNECCFSSAFEADAMEKYPNASTEPWVKRNTQQVQRPLDNTVLIRETVLMNTGPLQKFKVDASLESEIYDYPEMPVPARKSKFKTHYDFGRHDDHPNDMPLTGLQANTENHYQLSTSSYTVKCENCGLNHAADVDSLEESVYVEPDVQNNKSTRTTQVNIDEAFNSKRYVNSRYMLLLDKGLPPIPPRIVTKHTPEDEEPPPLPPRTAIKHEPQEQQDNNEDSEWQHFPTNMALLKLHSSSPIDDKICESGHMLLTGNTHNSRQALLQQNTTHRDEPEGMSSVDDEVTTPKHVYNKGQCDSLTYIKTIYEESHSSIYYPISSSSSDSEDERALNTPFENTPSGLKDVETAAVIDSGQGDVLSNIKRIYEESHSSIYYPTSSSRPDSKDDRALNATFENTPSRLKDVETAAVIDSGNCQTKHFVKERPRGYENHEIEMRHNLEGDLAPIQTIKIRQRKPMPAPRQRHTSNVYAGEEETPSCCKMSEFTPSGGLLEQKVFYLKNKKAELNKEIELQYDILKDGEEVNVLLEQKLRNAKQLTKQEMNRDDLETEMKNVNWHMQLEEYYGKTRTLIQVTRPSDAPTHDAMDHATFSEEADVQESTKASQLNIYIADSGIAEDNYSSCSECTKL